MKRLMAFALLLISIATPAHADNAPTIAVIDMGFNASLYSSDRMGSLDPGTRLLRRLTARSSP